MREKQEQKDTNKIQKLVEDVSAFCDSVWHTVLVHGLAGVLLRRSRLLARETYWLWILRNLRVGRAQGQDPSWAGESLQGQTIGPSRLTAAGLLRALQQLTESARR